MCAIKSRGKKKVNELVKKMKTIYFRSDKMNKKAVGTKCIITGITIPESRSQYVKQVKALGYSVE
jgi:hypothetical protein